VPRGGSCTRLAPPFPAAAGGSASQDGKAITVNVSGNACVTGFTTSTNFPTQGAYASSLSRTGFGLSLDLGLLRRTLERQLVSEGIRDGLVGAAVHPGDSGQGSVTVDPPRDAALTQKSRQPGFGVNAALLGILLPCMLSQAHRVRWADAKRLKPQLGFIECDP
jgi:hypothetical protein